MNIIIFLLNFSFLVLPQFIYSKDNKFDINFTTPISTSKSNQSKTEQSLYEENIKMKRNISMLIVDEHRNMENITSIDELNMHCQLLYSQLITSNTKTGFVDVFQSLLQGTGPLEASLLFLGFYPPYDITNLGSFYSVPLASLCVIFITFIICFAMMMQYCSVGIQEAFLARNNRSNYYPNEVFSAWDYGINSRCMADQQNFTFVLEMKTNLSEDRVKKEVTARSTRTWAKLYAIRFAINLIIMCWVILCYFLIFSATVFQMQELQKYRLTDTGFRTFFVQFLSSFTVIICNSMSPVLFSVLIPFEKYHAQTVLNVSLFRNVFLYLSSVMVLLNTFYQQTVCEPKDHCGAGLNDTCHSPRCWETYIGQQLFKLTLTDFFVYIGVFLGLDVVRNYFTRNFDNKFTRLWGPPAFNLSAEVLAPVNSQTILWLGVFYSPLLPAVMILKFVIIFYIKKTKILKFCDPSSQSYRASRFNATFIMILLVSFFTVLIGQSFAIERIAPSRGCGPFRQFEFMTQVIPADIRSVLSLFYSQWTALIITAVLCIVINYYWGVIISQKELTKQLKAQLVMQSGDKQYLLQQIANLAEGKIDQIPRLSKVSK